MELTVFASSKWPDVLARSVLLLSFQHPMMAVGGFMNRLVKSLLSVPAAGQPVLRGNHQPPAA
jgi:hypothetical protein